MGVFCGLCMLVPWRLLVVHGTCVATNGMSGCKWLWRVVHMEVGVSLLWPNLLSEVGNGASCACFNLCNNKHD